MSIEASPFLLPQFREFSNSKGTSPSRHFSSPTINLQFCLHTIILVMYEFIESLRREKSLEIDCISIVADPARLPLDQYQKICQKTRRHSMNVPISRWNSISEERIALPRSVSLPIDASPRRPARQDSLKRLGPQQQCQRSSSWVNTDAPRRPSRQESVKCLGKRAPGPIWFER